MTQAAHQRLTFEAFLQAYPDNGGRYELIEGEVVEVRPIGRHEEIAGFISSKLSFEILRLNLPYFIPKTALVKPDRSDTGYIPDDIVLDKAALRDDPHWEKYSTISRGRSARLIVEVVSTNWRDDYLTKLRDYEAMGIPEYWIVDYLALGATRYLGRPKQPTISVYRLVDGEYEVNQFRGSGRIVSTVFPELKLTAEQVFQA